MKPVIILLIIFFAVHYLRKSLMPKQAPKVPPKGRSGSIPPREDEEMVLDPICNSYIPISSALRVNRDGRVEYFCGTECKEKFLASK